MFLKFVKLYPLKAATTNAWLNKILSDYAVNVTRSKCILSNSGTQFASKIWKNKFVDMKIEVLFSPIRHPLANPSKICMSEFGKFFRTYCREAHRRWPEMLSDIEGWLNRTISDSTGCSPVELIFDNPRPDVFEEFLNKGSEQKPTADSLQEKVLKVYVRMKRRQRNVTKEERTVVGCGNRK